MYCLCGCGRKTKFFRGKYNKYIYGHNGNHYKMGHKFQGSGSHLWKKNHIPWNKGLNHSEETKKKLSKISKKQKNRNILGLKNGWGYWLNKKNPSMEGDKNPNWKNGVSKITKKKRQLDMETVEYVFWRRSVFERDDFTCISCGRRGRGYLVAHHIKSYSLFPNFRYEINNGCTLCMNCHNQTIGNEKRINEGKKPGFI